MNWKDLMIYDQPLDLQAKIMSLGYALGVVYLVHLADYGTL